MKYIISPRVQLNAMTTMSDELLDKGAGCKLAVMDCVCKRVIFADPSERAFSLLEYPAPLDHTPTRGVGHDMTGKYGDRCMTGFYIPPDSTSC